MRSLLFGTVATLGVWPLALLVAPVFADEIGAKRSNDAEALIRAALEAEVSGETDRRNELLHQALKLAPENEQARWLLGQIYYRGAWHSIEEIEKLAAADPKLAEYRRLCERGVNTVAGHFKAANWCRQNGLPDEERMHLRIVLEMDPDNKNALKRLDLVHYRGRFVTAAEKEQLEAYDKESEAADKVFREKLDDLYEQFTATEGDASEVILTQLATFNDPMAVPALLAQMDRENEAFAIAAVRALAEIPGQDAVEALMRVALSAKGEATRAAAAKELSKLSLHDYVPQLLALLMVPVEGSVSVNTLPDGTIQYTKTIYREGATEDVEMNRNTTIRSRPLVGREPILSKEPVIRRSRPTYIERQYPHQLRRVAIDAKRFQQSVDETNRRIDTRNEPIIGLLRDATGQEEKGAPQSWWDWWLEYNEYHVPDYKPVQEYNEYAYYEYGPLSGASEPPRTRPTDFYSFRKTSCFAKGTLVSTLRGTAPIEEIQIGDRVLSQNAETGELGYKIVIGRTLRPASPLKRLTAAGTMLLTTLGHPFWVSGSGWKMSKELSIGDRLHTTTGAVELESIEEAYPLEAYNLVVAEWHTYFVGPPRILVHDNSLREPTRATVPGMAAAEVGE